MDPQGVPAFGNVEHVTSGGYSNSHGIMPDVATIYAAAQPILFPVVSTFRITYGGKVLSLRDCLLDSVRPTTDRDGRQMLILTIKDRRWKWQKFGRIRGEYNIVEGTGTVRKISEKTPKELFKLLLAAMGETKFNISDVEDDVRPYVNWDGNPSVAMQDLAEALGLRVVYNFVTDSVDIRRVGVGANLPINETIIFNSLDINPQEYPDKLIFMAGKSLVDCLVDISLPLGEEVDGTIKPIDNLSYKPAGGWDRAMPPEFPTVAKKWRKLAQKCIWKWFGFPSPIAIPTTLVSTESGMKGQLANLKLHQILPLETHQGRTATVNEEGVPIDKQSRERVPAVLCGKFYGGYQALGQDAKEFNTSKGKLTKYEHGFSIDTERGFIMLSQPLFIFKDARGEVTTAYDATTGKIAGPPELYLLTGYGVRDEKTNAWYREEVSYVPPGPKLGTKPYYIDREDIYRLVYFTTSIAGTTAIDNLTEVQQQAKFYMNQEFRNFQMQMPGSIGYAGMVLFPPDGAIQQVTVQVSESGETTTVLSRNREQLFTPVTYDEQVRLTRVRAIIEEDAKKKTKRIM